MMGRWDEGEEMRRECAEGAPCVLLRMSIFASNLELAPIEVIFGPAFGCDFQFRTQDSGPDPMNQPGGGVPKLAVPMVLGWL